MKRVGIDFGTKRVGLAVSDETGSIAFPRAVFPNDRHLLAEVVGLVRAEQVGEVVVGESRGFDGADNPVMAAARRFAREVGQESGVPVVFEPEFYTTVEARRTAGPAALVDAEAAAIMLNSYLNRIHDATSSDDHA